MSGRDRFDGTQLMKPRLRGRLHQGGFVVSLATGFGLVVAASPGSARAAALVYALSVTALFGTSALYHRRHWSARARIRMQRLDHSMIFVLIAGTYTPLAVLALPQPTGAVVLWIVWGGAIIGGGLRILWRSFPSWMVYPLCGILGAVSLAVLPDLIAASGVVSMSLLAFGVVAYVWGAVILVTHRPNPLPAVFGYHEVFHLLTLVAGLSFFTLNAMVVTGV